MQPISYPPFRQRGYSIHILTMILFVAILTVCFWQATTYKSGFGLILWGLACLLSFLPLPFLTYRVYALNRGDYLLDRETLTIRWGLRLEQIPVSDVDWVRSAFDLTTPLRLPPFSMPGAILGIRHHPDLGSVEFLADNSAKLLLVATASKVFAISPNDPVTFTEDFQRIVEMGSLAPVLPQSIFPSFVVGQAWQSRPARFMWLTGLFLNIGLLVWVSLLVPNLESIPLGFLTTGVPRNVVPSVQLFLLPIISILFYFISWLAGLRYFRRPTQRIMAYFTWSFSTLSGLLFLMAVLFIISTPV
ncbi:MAG: PH domain-containing protein [Chloroflexota bacterium]